VDNVIELRNKDQRSLEASAWVARLDKGLSSAESDEIRKWIALDSRNKTLLSEMAGLWDDMDGLSRLSELFPNPIAEKRHGKSRWLLAAASGFVVLAVVLASVLFTMNTDLGLPGENAVVESATYQTAIGGLSTIQLSDGSRLTLNTNSLLDVDFTLNQRLIRLHRGELHIDVAHDADRPLSVIVGERVLQAVGTAFTVKIDENQKIELLVTDGVVRVGVLPHMVADAGGEQNRNSPGEFEDGTSVSKGERFMLDSSTELLERLEPEDVEVHLSWREGYLVFRGEALGDAAAEISRYTPVEFVFLDEELQKVRVAGLFKAGDVSGFLSSLEANFDIVYQRIDDGTIQLSSPAEVAD
jgi:transmembrane sensor